MDCPDPGTLTNGTKVGTDYSQGMSVNFSCDTGYRLIGEQQITCNTNGTWSSATPTCQGMLSNLMMCLLVTHNNPSVS